MTAPCYRPELHVLETVHDVADRAAERIIAFVTSTRRPVLGLATGRTPLPVYARLREAFAAGEVSFEDTTTFNLDEYRGFPNDHPASFHSYMRRQLFDHVDISPERCHLPDGTGDPVVAAARYEASIVAADGIGLQLLGIGENGHIGFNEPGATFDSRTRVVRLSASTLAANEADFPSGQTMPGEAITMGIGTILEARELLLLATGPAKARALAETLTVVADRAVPASALRFHPVVTILCDRAAARTLPRACRPE